MRLSGVLAALLLPAFALQAQYAGSAACRGCHPDKYASQVTTAHARALAVAPEGSPGQWAFGAGEKATTWVSQRDEDTILEHGLSYYSATKEKGLTPGHQTPADTAYRTFDAVGTALRCFRCHSTGPVNIDASYRIAPSETGVRCEACHGPGAAHVAARSRGTIVNPRRLGAGGINALCGSCHRQASELDDDTDWSNAWNVRHQPSYLHRAACFRNSGGALSCITCHNPHEPLGKTAASYDAKCAGCHRGVAHKTAVGSRSCVGCHMPQVPTSLALRFTNHWIGIYDPGKPLIPARRAVKTLKAAAASPSSGTSLPSDAATLAPLYEQALARREAELGQTDKRVARAASDLGLFLKQTGNVSAAEAPLRRALRIDVENGDTNADFDRESLASVLEALGRRDEAVALYREAAEGRDPKAATRSFTSLARLDPEGANIYYRRAVQAAETAFGRDERRVSALLHELALTLRQRNDDGAAEPLLRRALEIQRKAAQPDHHMTIAVMNTLGNLLEGANQLDEAERLEHEALQLAEQKFGPESAELAMTCTNLADIRWNRKDYEGAARFYQRALVTDMALYGAERTETAADIANLGMLLKEAGQATASDALLRRALAIYEKVLGPESAQSKYVREGLVPR